MNITYSYKLMSYSTGDSLRCKGSVIEKVEIRSTHFQDESHFSSDPKRKITHIFVPKMPKMLSPAAMMLENLSSTLLELQSQAIFRAELAPPIEPQNKYKLNQALLCLHLPLSVPAPLAASCVAAFLYHSQFLVWFGPVEQISEDPSRQLTILQ